MHELPQEEQETVMVQVIAQAPKLPCCAVFLFHIFCLFVAHMSPDSLASHTLAFASTNIAGLADDRAVICGPITPCNGTSSATSCVGIIVVTSGVSCSMGMFICGALLDDVLLILVCKGTQTLTLQRVHG